MFAVKRSCAAARRRIWSDPTCTGPRLAGVNPGQVVDLGVTSRTSVRTAQRSAASRVARIVPS